MSCSATPQDDVTAERADGEVRAAAPGDARLAALHGVAAVRHPREQVAPEITLEGAQVRVEARARREVQLRIPTVRLKGQGASLAHCTLEQQGPADRLEASAPDPRSGHPERSFHG